MRKRTDLEVEGRTVSLSNLDKILFPESGVTKAQIIDYYIKIAPFILPHLRDRPLTLKRYPDGVTGKHFYEKDAPLYTPEWVPLHGVWRKSGDSKIRYVMANDLPTLVWSANLANIEMHVFLARAPHIEQPTMIVFDLDPGEPATVLDSAEVALWLRAVLERLGLESFVKVSGSKGIHLHVPLNTPTNYEATQAFAHAIARLLERENPGRIVSEMSKGQRHGKVFIDWSQNDDHKTTVCVYSMRAKNTRPFIALPITWRELAQALEQSDRKALAFEPAAALERVKRRGDLFAKVQTKRQSLPARWEKQVSGMHTFSVRRKDQKRPLKQPKATAARDDTRSTGKRPPNAPGKSSISGEVDRAARRARTAARPTVKAAFVELMQCKPVTQLPDGEEWIYELKFDGYRCEAIKNGAEVELISRNRKSLTKRFPKIAGSVRALSASSILLDGEIVALDAEGRPSFQLLQNSESRNVPICYYVFDLLQCRGRMLLQLPLFARKRLLHEELSNVTDPIRFSPGLVGAAQKVAETITRAGLEGVVAKRRESFYEPGKRSGAWMKFKTNLEQEFVIGGYIPGSRHFDALLVGYYDGSNLIYVAKVKNGFVARTKEAVARRFALLRTSRCPFSNLPEKKGRRFGEPLTADAMKECVWLVPRLVCRIAFTEWTDAGHLRHSHFVGMRDDKGAGEVVNETAPRST